MSVSELLQRIVQGAADRKAAAVEDFAELVKTICDGEEPMPDRVDQLLTETGKTTDELAAAVARRQTRLELAAKKAKLPELRKRLQGIAEKLDAEQVQWNAAATRHEMIEPLLSQARQVFKIKEHLRIRNEGLSLASPQRMKAPGQELA